MIRITSLVAVALFSMVIPATADDLVPYQSDGWRYQQVSWADPLHDTFLSVDFDDSAWSVGQGGFGSGGGCALQVDRHADWAVNTDMLLRRPVFAAGGTEITVFAAIDNDIVIYFNGVEITATGQGGCAIYDEVTILVPAGIVIEGENVLAVSAHDYGSEAYVDVRVAGTPAVPIAPVTWGAIKSLYK